MTELYVEVRGERDKPALLLVHALGTDHRFWEEATAELARDYFCIIPDLQGSGRTPNPPEPMTAEEHAKDLAALLAEMRIGRAVVAGCAIGGMVAALLAAENPALAAGLVMTNPGLGNTEEVKDILRSRAAEVRAGGMEVLLPSAPERAFHGMPHDERYHRYVERYVAQDAEGYALSVLGFLEVDIQPALLKIKCPLLLIPGGNDVLMPRDGAEEIAKSVPQAQIVRFDDVAHFIPYQAPQRFAAELRRFMRDEVAW